MGPDNALKPGLPVMANALRVLSMDAVERARSGHPGMPMGMADVVTVLVSRFLTFDAAASDWPDRDRFVLSAGHGSMLLYALAYLLGYPDMDIDQIRNFRQLGSRTAGHPEYGLAECVETTTGPLGQGLANAVGMALAERMLASDYGEELVNHYTYALVGDGCLMEGISHEAISLAGHLALGKLIVLFDDNQISIDGPVDLAVSDDHKARFIASSWHVQQVDGHDPEAIATAIELARDHEKPSMIACRTVIARGSPGKQGTASAHGAPLGAEEVAATRAALDWEWPPFEIPDAVLKAWRAAGQQGADARTAWEHRLAASQHKADFQARVVERRLSTGWREKLDDYRAELCRHSPGWASRQSSQKALEVLTACLPELVGGSADLTGSNLTKTAATTPISPSDFSGRYIHYGVREHAMAAAMNGLALHGGWVPYGGTFLIFSDYCRHAIRLSALMGQQVIYVMTHDSIGLGEDGPTHQPIEHLASLRAMPNLKVFRPADAVETAECWAAALENVTGPSLLALSRQKLPALRNQPVGEHLCARGGYVLIGDESGGERAGVTLIATGSEVSIAVEAHHILAERGVVTRVVSLPCWELFDSQDPEYRRSVIPPDGLRVAIEAASSFGWERYIGEDGLMIGIDSFGQSAPGDQLYTHFGLTAQAVVAAILRQL